MTIPSKPSGTVLRMARRCVPATLPDLVAPDGAGLVLAPHPDDETLGCGAAIVAALSAGRSVGIVLLTDGCASHPNSRRYGPRSLAALRRMEFASAVQVLRDAADTLGEGRRDAELHTLCLGLPDTAVPCAADAGPAIDAIVRFADRMGARTLWCTWRGDPHCDHQAAASLADVVEDRRRASGKSLFRRDYAVWGRFGRADPPAGSDVLPFPHGRHGPAKAAAMGYYASQLTPLIDDDPAGFVMPPEFNAHFAAHPEVFIKSRRETL